MSGNNAYSSFASYHQYGGEEDDDQYHEEVEDNLEYDNNLDDSTYRKRNYLTYEEYELDEEDERLIREELGEYEPENNQSQMEHQEEENFDDITEEFLLTKVNELNKLAIQIDVLSFGGEQHEIDETREEMDSIIAFICRVTKVKRNIENYIKSDNKRISSSLPSLFIDLKADIRKLFHSEVSILSNQQTSFNTTQEQNEVPRETKHYNSVVDEHHHHEEASDEEEDEDNYQHDDQEAEEDHDQEEEEEHDEENHNDSEEEKEAADQEESEPYEPYEPTYYEDNDDVDYTLDAEDDELSNLSEEDSDDVKLLDSLRDECMKKSIELIKARNEREKALTTYHCNEMLKKDPNSKERQQLVQQLVNNCRAELDQLNKEIVRFSREALEIRKQTELNKPPPKQKTKKIPKTPEKKRIEKIEHLVPDITTPRANKDAVVMLTPSQLKERQENSDLQNMYNRLEASLSRTPQAKEYAEEKPKPGKPKPSLPPKNTSRSVVDPNLSMEPSKEKKTKPVPPTTIVSESIENPRKKAAERLKEKIQKEKEQKEKEDLEKQEKLKKLEEICSKQQTIILEERKALTTKKYLEEILSDDSDEERMKEMEDEERRKMEEEKIAEARRKAILRAKEKKRKEIEREKEMEEERKKREAEKWRKRDEGLMAFKLKQEMDKEKKIDVRTSKPSIPVHQPQVIKPKLNKEAKPATSQKTRKSLPSQSVTESPLLDGLDAHDDGHDYLQFSPPPPMFSTSKPKK